MRYTDYTNSPSCNVAGKLTFTDEDLFDELLDTFRHYAKEFSQKNQGQPAVLVIDNTNYLANDNPRYLALLQDIAKNAADRREFTTVFVCSESRAPLMMMSQDYVIKYIYHCLLTTYLGRSAESRMRRIYQVPDLRKEEAFAYLCDKRGQTCKVAQKIYNVIGGRIKHLQAVVNGLQDGNTLESMQDLFSGSIYFPLTSLQRK